MAIALVQRRAHRENSRVERLPSYGWKMLDSLLPISNRPSEGLHDHRVSCSHLLFGLSPTHRTDAVSCCRWFPCRVLRASIISQPLGCCAFGIEVPHASDAGQRRGLPPTPQAGRLSCAPSDFFSIGRRLAFFVRIPACRLADQVSQPAVGQFPFRT